MELNLCVKLLPLYKRFAVDALKSSKTQVFGPNHRNRQNQTPLIIV